MTTSVTEVGANAKLFHKVNGETSVSYTHLAKQKDDFKEGRPRISKIKIDHALSLLDEGYSYKQVERMTGISTATLARRKRERLLEEDS